ncbi:MAG: hypothetical protein QM736_27205 [Vicinamibacterales bacterium]
MRLRTFVGGIAAVLAMGTVPARADVHITIADGHVTVSAKDATIRQILTEWARVGQTRIVNADRVAGPPVTIELTNVPEAQALDTILRSVSGYLAAPRAVPIANASSYDRIFLLATSNASPARPSGPAPQGPQVNARPAPVFAVPPPDDQPDDDAPSGGPPVPQPNGLRGPGFQAFPQPQAPPQRQGQVQGAQPQVVQPPQVVLPQRTPPTTFGAPSTTGAPVGVSTPGMVVPAPQQQQQDQSGDRR